MEEKMNWQTLYLIGWVYAKIFKSLKKGVKAISEREKAKKILGSDEEFQKFLRSKKKEKQIALQSALRSNNKEEADRIALQLLALRSNSEEEADVK